MWFPLSFSVSVLYYCILVFKTKRSIIVQYYIIDSIPDALALAPASRVVASKSESGLHLSLWCSLFFYRTLDKKLVVLFPRICVLLEGFPSGSTVLHWGRESHHVDLVTDREWDHSTAHLKFMGKLGWAWLYQGYYSRAVLCFKGRYCCCACLQAKAVSASPTLLLKLGKDRRRKS